MQNNGSNNQSKPHKKMPNASSNLINAQKTNNKQKADNKESLQIAIIGGGLTGLITAELLEQSFKNATQEFAITIFEKSAGVGRLATRYKQPENHDANTVAKFDSGVDSSVDSSVDSRVANGMNSNVDKDVNTNNDNGNDSEVKNVVSTVNNAKKSCQWQFDFGAQFFTAKSKQFQAYLQPYLDEGVVEPWLAKTAEVSSFDIANIQAGDQCANANPRYISSPKMTSLGRTIAKKLKHTKIRYKTRVSTLSDDLLNGQKTQLFDISGNNMGCYDWIICTAPQAQAVELLQATSFKHNSSIQQHKMLACYSLMLGWDQTSQMPKVLQNPSWDVLEIGGKESVVGKESKDAAEQTVIGRVFIEHHKPSRENILPSITIHANNNWSERHVDDDIEVVQHQLVTHVQKLFLWQDTTAPIHIDCHRWRYAATKYSAKDNKQSNNDTHYDVSGVERNSSLSYLDNDKKWIVTGDWCDEGRIESCFKAAQDVVDIITNKKN